MENRFGFKEFLISGLLVVLIVLTFLRGIQYDRQQQRMLRLSEQSDQQVKEQAQLRREVSQLKTLLEERLAIGGGQSVSVAASQPDNPLSLTKPSQGQEGGTRFVAFIKPKTNPMASPVSGARAEDAQAFERMLQAKAKPDYADGDWCIDAFGANVAKITPLVSGDVYGSVIQSRVIESLADRDPQTLLWRPLLAKHWTISDDGLTIVFQLRPEATFSDGQPVTAQDVVFTYELIQNPQVECPRHRQAVDKIASVTAQGDHQVTFVFREPFFASLELAAGFDVLPKHFYSKFTPKQINETPGLLLGSGPYRMQSPTDWSPGKLLTLVRNERYWGTPPAFDRLVYREVSLEAARLAMFRNREIDLYGAQPEEYRKLLKDEAFLKRTHHFEFERIVGGYGFIAWNQMYNGQTPTVFADARVRRAMTMMIDRQRLFDELLLGFGIAVTGPFNRLSKQTDPDIQPWPFDIAQAKALLRQAGYEDRDGDGVLDGPDGKPLKFKVTFPSQTNSWDRLLLMLKDNLAKAGVVMELDPLEWSVFEQRIKKREFQALCMAWAGGIESDIRQMFHSSQIADQADNFIGYRNPQLDRLIDQARSTVDEAKRMELWRACHRIIHEDQPYTFLYSRKTTQFIDGRIHHVQQTRLGLNDRNEWYVPKTMQLRKN